MKPYVAFIAIALLATSSTLSVNTLAAEPPIRFAVDAQKSSFTVRVFSGGLLGFAGHDHTIAIRDFSGDVHITPGSIEPASLQLTIRSASLEEVDKRFDEKDRREINKTMREEVLETGKYPEIVFKSTRVTAKKTADGSYELQIWGDLTLHGVTKSGMIQARLTMEGNVARARGQFPVQLSEYNLKRISFAAGAIKVKDKITLSFDIVARQV